MLEYFRVLNDYNVYKKADKNSVTYFIDYLIDFHVRIDISILFQLKGSISFVGRSGSQSLQNLSAM